MGNKTVKEVTENYVAKDVEASVRAFWNENNTYRETRKLRANGKDWLFVDGPPYTTGYIHLGTAWNKILKDAILRYQSMNGKHIVERAGYDMHGLPIEVKVEEKLGFKNYVSNNVLITHSSRGNRNRPYAEARLLVYANHRNNLPLFASDIPESQKESIQQSVSYKQLKRTVRLLIRTGYSDKEVVSFIEEWNKYAKGLMKISPKLYIALMKTIVFFIERFSTVFALMFVVYFIF